MVTGIEIAISTIIWTYNNLSSEEQIERLNFVFFQIYSDMVIFLVYPQLI